MARHLSTKQLTSWLNGAVDHEEHTEHLDSCSKCAARIEELHDNNVEPLTAEFAPALLQILQPPADLHERISKRIALRLQAQSDRDLFTSMLGVPVETLKVMTESDISNVNLTDN